ncbi:MAG: hypothetical protein ACKOA8_14015 [Deltaproteobacteria bacterium]
MKENQAKEGGSKNPSGKSGPGSLRALALAALAGATVLTSTGCTPVTDAVKGAFVDEGFPSMPSPEIATYIVDLSGSTYPIQQLKALGSGIEEFISGSSLGDPFRSPKLAPKSLSIQFITQNSANAGRISLVSAETGVELYNFVQSKTPNLDQAKPLWDGFVRARSELASSSVEDLASCQEQAIGLFGQQGLSQSVLREPARLICSDILKSQVALQQLGDFVANPDVPLGSDVYGAIDMAVSNLRRADMQFPMSQKTLVIASDLIDQTPKRGFKERIKASSSNDEICDLAKQDVIDEYGKSLPFEDLFVVLVGQGNSRADVQLLNQVRKYWTCYFQSAGAEVIQTTDLNNY